MSRYLLFGYDAYYPGGGWNDFISAHDTIQAAKTHAVASKDNSEFLEIVSLEAGRVVSEGFWVAGVLDPKKARYWRDK